MKIYAACKSSYRKFSIVRSKFPIKLKFLNSYRSFISSLTLIKRSYRLDSRCINILFYIEKQASDERILFYIFHLFVHIESSLGDRPLYAKLFVHEFAQRFRKSSSSVTFLKTRSDVARQDTRSNGESCVLSCCTALNGNGCPLVSRSPTCRETVDGGGCPDAVAWVERSRCERTRSEVERERESETEGLKEWQGGACRSSLIGSRPLQRLPRFSPFILVPRVLVLPTTPRIRFVHLVPRVPYDKSFSFRKLELLKQMLVSVVKWKIAHDSTNITYIRRRRKYRSFVASDGISWKFVNVVSSALFQ